MNESKSNQLLETGLEVNFREEFRSPGLIGGSWVFAGARSVP